MLKVTSDIFQHSWWAADIWSQDWEADSGSPCPWPARRGADPLYRLWRMDLLGTVSWFLIKSRYLPMIILSPLADALVMTQNISDTSGVLISWRSRMVLGNSWASAKIKENFYLQGSRFLGRDHSYPLWDCQVCHLRNCSKIYQYFLLENFNWATVFPPHTNMTSHLTWTR